MRVKTSPINFKQLFPQFRGVSTFKARVHYFSSNSGFSPNNCPSTMKNVFLFHLNHLKNSFRS